MEFEAKRECGQGTPVFTHAAQSRPLAETDPKEHP